MAGAMDFKVALDGCSLPGLGPETLQTGEWRPQLTVNALWRTGGMRSVMRDRTLSSRMLIISSLRGTGVAAGRAIGQGFPFDHAETPNAGRQALCKNSSGALLGQVSNHLFDHPRTRLSPFGQAAHEVEVG